MRRLFNSLGVFWYIFCAFDYLIGYHLCQSESIFKRQTPICLSNNHKYLKKKWWQHQKFSQKSMFLPFRSQRHYSKPISKTLFCFRRKLSIISYVDERNFFSSKIRIGAKTQKPSPNYLPKKQIKMALNDLML
jgi:hypothetical protein